MQNRRASSSDLVALRAAHLGMIQGVISRMSGFSATAKNFAVTASVAIVAVAFDKEVPPILRAGGVAVAAFFLMDAYYHLLEVRFRKLYKTIAEQPVEIGSDMMLDAPAPTRQDLAKVLKSKTLLPFYVLLLFSLWIALKEVPHVDKANPAPVSNSSCDAGKNAGSRQCLGRPTQSASAEERARGLAKQAVNSAGDERTRHVR